MNSLVSYEWIKEYVDLSGVSPEEFAKRISLSGPGVEKIYPASQLVSPLLAQSTLIVGRVRELIAHPNAEKLRIARVDVGAKSQVEIVCGGSNLSLDQWVAVALPGSRVQWHGQGDPVTLEPAEIRGVRSFGMICAANEIGLGEIFPHAEREILDLSVLNKKMKAGETLVETLDLASDVVMDIEVTSNRVDAMGMVGMAREASAILQKKFRWKDPVGGAAFLKRKGKPRDGIRVALQTKKACRRYLAVRMEGVRVGPSPWWMQRRLLLAGMKPINNLVDCSNYVLLELAQPTYLFDAAKLDGGIQVRFAQEGESLQALDGKTYPLASSHLVIADAQRPIALAGIIGGEESKVTPSTTSIVVECACFDPLTIRRGARALNLQTDAQLRFEKGLSTAGLPEALVRTVKWIQELAGGTVVGPVTDVGETTYVPQRYAISTDEVARLIGVPVAPTEIMRLLSRLGFQPKRAGKKLTTIVPWWRDQDVEDRRDLVEEIARVKGYATIPAVIPVGLASRPMDPELIWERVLREISKGAGLTETYTYSFVSSDLLMSVDYDPTRLLRVQNPLSTEFEYMRTTLLPSLLQVAAANQERFPLQQLFEIANVYYPPTASIKSPADEQLELGALFVGMSQPWKSAKGYVEHLLSELGMTSVVWRSLTTDSFWHPGRTAQAYAGDQLLATVGEVSPRIAARFKFEGPVGCVDLPLERVIPLATSAKRYISIPAFPVAKRDLAVVLADDIPYMEVARAIQSVDERVTTVEWFDTYRGTNLPEGMKSLAMHLSFSAPDRTLESKEVDEIVERVLATLREKFQAALR